MTKSEQSPSRPLPSTFGFRISFVVRNSEFGFDSSLTAQRLHRIDIGSAPGRQPTGEQHDDHHHSHRRYEDTRVHRTDLKEHALHRPAHAPGAEAAEGEAHSEQSRAHAKKPPVNMCA